MKDKQRDEGDQELIKQQQAEQRKSDDGKVKPMAGDIRVPEQKK